LKHGNVFHGSVAKRIRGILVQEQDHQIVLATALGVRVPNVTQLKGAATPQKKPGNRSVSIVARNRLLVATDSLFRRNSTKGLGDETCDCSNPDCQFGLARNGRMYRKEGLYRAGDEDHDTRRDDHNYNREGRQDNRRSSVNNDALNAESSDGRMVRASDGRNIFSPKKGTEKCHIQP